MTQVVRKPAPSSQCLSH